MPPKSSGQSQLPQEGQNQLLEIFKGLGIKTEATRKAPHGMTAGQVEELRLKISGGEPIQKIKANNHDTYEINEHEKHLIHVFLEKVEWDPNSPTPRKISAPGRVQKFYVNDFNLMSKVDLAKGEKGTPQNAFGAYSIVKILHDPRKKEGVADPVAEVKTEVDLNTLEIDELRVKYFELTGEDADPSLNPPQLIFYINQANEGREEAV